MRTSFHHRPSSNPFDDPFLFVRMTGERRAMLFDLGSFYGISQTDILKLSDVFVTHTHIDHFIGFDHLLRTLLKRDKPLNIYGPANIIDCVEGKLRGYAWNLIKEYPFNIEAFAIDSGTIRHASFRSENEFRRMEREERPFDGMIVDETGFTIKASILDHDTPSIAYAIEEDYHINIDKARLDEIGHPVGPWLAELKKSIRNGEDGTVFRVGDKNVSADDLKDIIIITKGQKISYVMDSSPTEDNFNKIVDLVRDSDVLYCEAYFLHEDLDRARQRHHMTARLAGEMALKAGVREMVALHFSPKYSTTPNAPKEEALRAFRGD